MIDPALLQAIARLMVPQEGSYVAVEIGAGIGTLTSELAARVRKVYALEMDESLAPSLARTTGHLPNVQVIWGDALRFDLSGESTSAENPNAPLLLCGSLPYYITSEILYSALCGAKQVDQAGVCGSGGGWRAYGRSPGSKDFGRLSLWCQYRAYVAVEKKIS
jgi:16S rRNA (adenine1518-N6/adenine1519-N6)-dimethyltransferase